MTETILTAVIAGATGIVGSLVGGFATWLTTASAENRRHNLELKMERREVYGRVLALLAELSAAKSKDEEDSHSNMVEKYVLIYSEMQIVCSPSVWPAADQLLGNMRKSFFSSSPSTESRDAMKTLRINYVNAVRSEFGLAPLSTPNS